MEKKETWKMVINLISVICNVVLTTFFASCTISNHLF